MVFMDSYKSEECGVWAHVSNNDYKLPRMKSVPYFVMSN